MPAHVHVSVRLQAFVFVCACTCMLHARRCIRKHTYAHGYTNLPHLCARTDEGVRHVSAHTHMCLCMNAHMVVNSFTCLRAHVVCAPAFASTQIYASKNTHARMHACLHKLLCARAYIRVCVLMHTCSTNIHVCICMYARDTYIS